MVVEVIDEADRGEKSYYIIPVQVGQILVEKFGDNIYDPSYKMGDLLYDCYMSFCTYIGDNLVSKPDIIFHLC